MIKVDIFTRIRSLFSSYQKLRTLRPIADTVQTIRPRGRYGTRGRTIQPKDDTGQISIHMAKLCDHMA